MYDSPSYQEYLREERKKKLKEAAQKDCDSLKSLLQGKGEKELYAKIEEVKKYYKDTKPHKIIETGYLQYQDGSFVALDTTDGGHSLMDTKLRSDPIKGSIHNHTKKTYDLDNTPKIPIQVFSPRDILAFQENVLDHNATAGTYTMLIAKKYIYRLSVVGESKEIRSQVEQLKRQGAIQALATEYKNIFMASEESAVSMYTDVDSLYDQLIDLFVKQYPLNGLVIQRVKIDSKTPIVETTVLSVSEETQDSGTGNTTKVVEKINSDC